MSGRKFRLPACSVLSKILLVFLVLSILSLVVSGIVAYATISGIGFSAERDSIALGNQAVNDATGALEQAAEKNLVQLAFDEAEITNVLFEDTITEMEILAAQAKTVGQNSPLITSTRPHTRGNPPVDPADATVIFLAPGSDTNTDTEEYRTLEGMSDLLRAVYIADTNLTSVYVATDSGIALMYPWRSFANGTIDPRNRDWFNGAKKTPDVYWSEPYMDSAGHGLVVTASKAVQTKYGTWVIGSDVTVDVINSAFLNKTLGGQGYAVLMDNRGVIISRPGLSSHTAGSAGEYIPENAFQGASPTLAAISRNMTTGRTGLDKTRFENVETYIAYAPVRSMNWSYAVSMPVDEVTEPIQSTRDQIASATISTGARIKEQTDRILVIFAGLILALILVVAILSVFLARVITRPVEVLKKGASAIGRGDLDYRVRLESRDEFEDLARSFNQMAGDLKQNIDDLRRTTAEKERYTKELEIAKEIQESFLPEFIPQIQGYDITATTIPAMEIGGDLYDFIPLEGGRWGLVIADVSGKSVSAALYMALSRTLLHAGASEHFHATSTVQWVNRMLFDDGRSGMFITVFYSVLDPVSRTFTYVNAGHNPPLLVKKNGQKARYLDGRDIALGVIPEVNAGSHTVVLEPGDMVFMYTDGVTEAFNEQDMDFGEERLIEYLEKNRSFTAREIQLGLLAEIRQFRGNAHQSDDITLLVLRVE
ncbi:SpoIIE family protein phosphatase [uncultured Methanoregula sp.]|uniref:SpoIIE family protein phosphatase n=1 Tax=uncultured Methanoregula sp. TaxID=1005933 RepID=UPI002AAAF9FB|nr:SpoIIE family protein phosphatase [uncultured Methanoregula sp.]